MHARLTIPLPSASQLSKTSHNLKAFMACYKVNCLGNIYLKVNNYKYLLGGKRKLNSMV
jgi:hypothetical protein